jgi:hypothetical protein
MNRTARRHILVSLTAVAAVLVGCGPRGTAETAKGVTLLRFGHLNGSPAGLVSGRLSFANGCVSLEAAPGVPVTGMWASGTRLDTSTGVVRLVVDGTAFAEGDELSMGGGEYTDEVSVVSLVGTIPGSCRGEHYWLLTELVRK